MPNMKNVLTLVVLSAGLLTALAGTTVSQVALADKDKDECKDNGDFNCNEETQKIHQDDNCKVVNENKNNDKSDKNANDGTSSGEMTCVNFGQNPQNGEALVDLDIFPPDPFALIP